MGSNQRVFGLHLGPMSPKNDFREVSYDSRLRCVYLFLCRVLVFVDSKIYSWCQNLDSKGFVNHEPGKILHNRSAIKGVTIYNFRSPGHTVHTTKTFTTVKGEEKTLRKPMWKRLEIEICRFGGSFSENLNPYHVGWNHPKVIPNPQQI